MEHQGPPINWEDVSDATAEGRLLDLLMTLPRARWAELGEDNTTFLHYACCGSNVAALVALLKSGLVDVNAPSKDGFTPAHAAAMHAQQRALEVLCAAGANLRALDRDDFTPIDPALASTACVQVLVANGVRLSVARDFNFHLHRITPQMEAFEHGVLRCRAAVVAMLRVKRASGQLVRWDKFLLVEVALCIWSTRFNKEWSEN